MTRDKLKLSLKLITRGWWLNERDDLTTLINDLMTFGERANKVKQLTTAKRCRPFSGWLSNLSIVLIKDGRVTFSCQEVSQMFDCFILFLTNHVFIILTLVFNLNLRVFLPILDQTYLTRAELMECCSPGWRSMYWIWKNQIKSKIFKDLIWIWKVFMFTTFCCHWFFWGIIFIDEGWLWIFIVGFICRVCVSTICWHCLIFIDEGWLWIFIVGFIRRLCVSTICWHWLIWFFTFIGTGCYFECDRLCLLVIIMLFTVS